MLMGLGHAWLVHAMVDKLTTWSNHPCHCRCCPNVTSIGCRTKSTPGRGALAHLCGKREK